MIKIKNKMVILYIFLCVYYLFFVVNVENVFSISATINVKGTLSGDTTPCQGGNCFSLGTGGIRVTLLDKNGNIVKDSNGKEVKIVDLWFFGDSDDILENNKLENFDFKDKGISVKFRVPKMRQQYQNFEFSTISNTVGQDDSVLAIGEDYDFRTIENENEALEGILQGLTKKWSGEQYYCSSIGKLCYNNNDSVWNFEKSAIHVHEDIEHYKKDGNIVELKGYNTRVANSTEIIMKRIYDNITKDTIIYRRDPQQDGTKAFGEFKTIKKGTYINNLLKLICTGTNLNLNISNLPEIYYLEFEPLIAWQNRALTTWNHYPAYNFYGSVTEFYLLASYVNYNSPMLMNSPFCKSGKSKFGFCADDNGSIYGSNGVYNYMRSAFNFVNAHAFYGISNVGVFSNNDEETKNVIPNNIFTPVDNQPPSDRPNVVIPKNQNSVALKEAYGVAFISLADFVNNATCNEVARDVLSNLGTDINKFLEEIKSGKDKKYEKVTEKCVENGEISNKCPLLQPEFLEVFGVVDTEYKVDEEVKKIDICEPLDCSSILASTPSLKPNVENHFDPDDNYYVEKDFDNAPDFYKNIKKFREYIIDHPSLFTNTNIDNLDYNVYKGIYNKAPSCSEILECNTNGVKALCENDDKLIFSDSRDDCIKEGIAYNNKSATSTINSMYIQSSYDDEYETYCKEEVSFNFPKSVSKVKAGTLFKWGTNNSTINDEYGSMTVTRTCYFTDDLKTKLSKITGVNQKSFTTKWADVYGKKTYTSSGSTYYDSSNGRINPIIKLNYEEAVPTGYPKHSFEKELSVYLSSVKMDTYLVSDLGGGLFPDNNYTLYNLDGSMIVTENESLGLTKEIIDTYAHQEPRQFTCDLNGSNPKTKCVNIDRFVVEADYKIVYTDNLKWYAKKSDYGNYKTIDDDTIYEDASTSKVSSEYLLLGYGLPTSFVTPTNLAIEKDKSYGYNIGTDENKGKLYITVQNIGTKNPSSDKTKKYDGYHFDEFLKFNITDGATVDGKREDAYNDKLVYSCGFNIYNELFGYENGPCGANGEECDTTKVPKGIDVVFRTVDLINSEDDIDNAFPGRSGDGTREKGRNWAKYDDETILKILNSDAYSNNPMYHINLTSDKIQEIRNLNQDMKNENKDPYTDMSSYEFYYNETDTGVKLYTYAASDFVTYIATEGWLESDSTCKNFTTNTAERAKYNVTMNSCLRTVGIKYKEN